jgi:hypothetical protein
LKKEREKERRERREERGERREKRVARRERREREEGVDMSEKITTPTVKLLPRPDATCTSPKPE